MKVSLTRRAACCALVVLMEHSEPQRVIAVGLSAHEALVTVLRGATTTASTLTLACRALALLSCTPCHAECAVRNVAVPSLITVLRSTHAASSSRLAINACCTLHCIFQSWPAALNSALALALLPVVEAVIALHADTPQLEISTRPLLALLHDTLDEATARARAEAPEPPLAVQLPMSTVMITPPAPSTMLAAPVGGSSASPQTAAVPQLDDGGLGDLLSLLGMAPATQAEAAAPVLPAAAMAAPASRLRADAGAFSPALHDGGGSSAMPPAAANVTLTASLLPPALPPDDVQKPPAIAAPPPYLPVKPAAAAPVSDGDGDEPPTCIICLDAPCSVVLLPCAHLLLCSAAACAAMLGAPPRCPLCRVAVERNVAVAGPPSKWVPPNLVRRGAVAIPPPPQPQRCAGGCGAGLGALCTLLLPCRHMPLCGHHGCAEATLGQKERRRRCPSCKAEVTSTLRVFL